MRGVKFGDNYLSTDYEQAIFDNGMSYNMAPHSDFIALVKMLSDKHDITCSEMTPLWVCVVPDDAKFEALPKLKFNLVKNESGESQYFEMPAHGYFKMVPGMTSIHKETGKKVKIGRITITPWEF